MIFLSENEIVLSYIDEMLEIFNDVLIEDFDESEEPSIFCAGTRFFKKDFESLKLKIDSIT